MFKTEEIRKSAYFVYSNWPGGFYGTVSITGSRSGAPIIGAWVAMQYHGMKGYFYILTFYAFNYDI